MVVSRRTNRGKTRGFRFFINSPTTRIDVKTTTLPHHATVSAILLAKSVNPRLLLSAREQTSASSSEIFSHGGDTARNK